MEKPVFEKEALLKTLRENSSVEVSFVKKSTGQNRVMLCTLNETVLAADGASVESTSERKSPEHLVHVYDLEASGWRSFDINTVYAVSV